MKSVVFRDDGYLPMKDLIALYRANKWSSAKKPVALRKSLLNSDGLVTAWDGKKLVGLGNAISDGFLVVYYSHLLVLPEYQGQGLGRKILRRLQRKYRTFHQQVLVADGKAVGFYKRCGFKRAGKTKSMWIYAGADH